jgi:membrane associated rhomboid family serine protease
MRNVRHLFLSIPLGCRTLLVIFFIIALANLILSLEFSFSPIPYLCLSGPQFWSGEVWRILSHGCFPANLPDVAWAALLMAIVGSWVEVRSNRWILFGICLAGILGAGAAKVLLMPRAPTALIGLAPIGVALLAAWIKLCGNEDVMVVLTTVTKVRIAGMIFSILSLIIVFFSCSPMDGLMVACAWPSGWTFLWCHDRFVRARSARLANSNRMGRLEI